MIEWLSHLHEYFVEKEPFVVATITAYRGSSPESPGVALIYSAKQSHRFTSSDYRYQILTDAATELLASPAEYRTSTLALGKVAGMENGYCDVLLEYFDAQYYPDWLRTLRQKTGEGINCKLLREFDKTVNNHSPRTEVLVEGDAEVPDSVDPQLLYSNDDCVKMENDASLLLLRTINKSSIEVTLVGNHPVANEIENQAMNLPITVARVKTLPTQKNTIALNESTIVIIMTSDHEADLLQCEIALKQLVDHSGFVGCIGSVRKADIFKSRLQDKGVTQNQLQQFHMPVGLPEISGKQTSIVAASIIAQVLSQHQW